MKKVSEKERQELKKLRGSRETKDEFNKRLASYLRIYSKNPNFPWKKDKPYGRTIKHSIIEMAESPGFKKDNKVKYSKKAEESLKEFRASEKEAIQKKIKALRKKQKVKKLKKYKKKK